jgi:hypothetical protein
MEGTLLCFTRVAIVCHCVFGEARMKRLLGISVVITIILLSSTVYGYKLPDTGLTTCYSTSGEDETCFGTGEDGAFNDNPISYKENYDGTVTDNNTGLMWQQQDDGATYNWYQASGESHWTLNRDSAINVCRDLNLPEDSPYDDWRLPTNKELLSIVNYFLPNTNPNPAIDTEYFPNTKSNSYWSVTHTTPGSWYVNFYNGHTDSWFDDTAYYVRCVRGAENIQGFTNNNDGTVTDNSTGLMWEQGEPGQKTWSDALYYCNNQTLANKTDWRLPNIKELQSLASYVGGSPAIDTNYFPGAHSSYYWSSTTYRDHFDNARYVHFSEGDISYWGKNQSLYVRCVRAGEDGSTTDSLVKLTRPVNASFLYATIQDAYHDATDNSVIRAQATDVTEDILFTSSISVSLKGGYNSDFSANSLMTNLTGSITIKGGTVTIENLIIK